MARAVTRHNRRALKIILLLLTTTLVVTVRSAPPASALPITVRVTISKIAECCGSNFDSGIGPDADFYGRVYVAGQKKDIPEGGGQNTYHVNLALDFLIDHRLPSVPVQIEVHEEDGNVFNGANDDVDVSSAEDATPRYVNLSVDLHGPAGSCSLSGDLNAACGVDLTSKGNEQGLAAEITFKVELVFPVHPPGLHVRCTHHPVWPRPGEIVTITAESLGDQPPAVPANALAALQERIADSVEVWFTTDDGRTRTVLARRTNEATLVATATAGAAGSTFSYACDARVGGLRRFSGWRTTGVDLPPAGRVVPLSVGEPDHKRAVDVVLAPATVALPGYGGQQPYVGPRDAAFLAEVSRILREELFRHQLFLEHQARLNLWLSLDGGGAATGCRIDVPPNLAAEAPWSNATGVVHRNNVPRECARGRAFSTEANEAAVFAHELSHAAFNLADEYANDGGYWQANPYPNVYDSLTACQSDAADLQRAPSTCRGFDSVRDLDVADDVWVSDPPSNDLMVDDRNPQAADIRRIRWVLETECAAFPGRC